MTYVTKSIYLYDTKLVGSNFLDGRDQHQPAPISYTPTNMTTGWTVGKTASGSYCSVTASTTAVAGNFRATFRPDGGLDTTTGEGWVFGPYSGVFNQATMSVVFNFIATTVSAQAGRFLWRLWKANNVAGNSPTPVVDSVQQSGTGAVIANGSLVLSSNFPMSQSVVMNNEYLFLEVAWGITTAAGSNNANVLFRRGSGSYFKVISGSSGNPAYSDNSIQIYGDDMPGYA